MGGVIRCIFYGLLMMSTNSISDSVLDFISYLFLFFATSSIIVSDSFFDFFSFSFLFFVTLSSSIVHEEKGVWWWWVLSFVRSDL